MISAAEQHVLGCPLPASVVDRTESMRRRVAMFINAGTREAVSTGMSAIIPVPGSRFQVPGSPVPRFWVPGLGFKLRRSEVPSSIRESQFQLGWGTPNFGAGNHEL